MCNCAGVTAQVWVRRSCAQEMWCPGQQVLQRGLCEHSYAASRSELALHNHKTFFILLVTLISWKESDLHVKSSSGCLLLPYWYPNADREECMSQGPKSWFWKLRLCCSPMLGMFILLTRISQAQRASEEKNCSEQLSVSCSTPMQNQSPKQPSFKASR